MMKFLNTKHSSLSLFFLLILNSGCEVGDNQLIVPQERLEIANPAPAPRDYKSINRKHKILMAIVDFGVDYNHPKLKNNMHFTLDNNGNPTGVGHDFVGADSWPSPYLAMTADIDPDITNNSRHSALQISKHLQEAIDLFPELENFINPFRRIDQEADSNSIHGTHVAGLMTYDAPELGLLSYRVMPANQIYKDGQLRESEMGERVIADYVLRALNMASASGVKVVNLSLAMEIKNQVSPKDSPEYKTFDEIYKKIELFVKTHPEMAFVASSGNSGSWINSKTHRQFPCGINAANLICVGALDREGNLASFSNILLTKSPFILSPGVDIISIIPEKMCLLKNSQLSTSETTDLLADDTDAPWNDPQMAREYLTRISQRCLQNNGHAKLSGTSMSSPIIARALAKVRIKNPELNGAQAITKLLSLGKKFQEGNLILTKLQIEKPSWYDSEINIDKLTDPSFIKEVSPKLIKKKTFDFKIFNGY